MPMLPVTTGPDQPPPAPIVQAAAPVLSRLDVESHGYTYVVLGNTLLPEAEVRRALAQAKTPRDALADLRAAYLARGYFLVALVAKVDQQQVLLRVVQGRLTHIDGPEDIARFFDGLKNDETVRSSDVIRRSLLAQAYAATNGKQPQIGFKPAPEVGGSTMQIEQKNAPDQRPVGASLTYGNYGNRYAGHQLAQAQFYARHNGFSLQANYSRALTGMDENTRGAYYAAGGATLSWVNPWGIYQVDDQYTKYELGKAFAPLYPVGRIHVWGLSGTQYLYADDRTRWTVSEGAHAIHDQETVFQGFYTLRNQRYFVTDLGTDASWRLAGLAGRPASLAVGGQVKWGGARAADGFSPGTGNPTPHFRIYALNASVSQALPHDYVASFSLNGQHSTDILPSYEQWVLGGLNNIAAYLPGTVVGDRGYLTRAALQAPQWSLGPLRWRPTLYGEYGTARYTYVPPKSPTWQRLADLGLSLNLDLPAAGLSAMLSYAKPVGASGVARSYRAGQRSHLFFYLQAAF